MSDDLAATENRIVRLHRQGAIGVTTSAQSPNADISLGQDFLYAIRYYVGSRRGLLVLAAVVLVVGAALNWSRLVAVGLAPLLLSAAPCAAMCALGLCMS
jgi:hypothetical protein